MSVIFLAECGSKQQAEVFSQHFEGLSWTLKDDIESQCHAEIRQDFEGNSWCSLSASGIDWTPVNRQEGNYRYFQIMELEVHLQDHLKSAPSFRYGFIGEIGEQDLNYLLTNSNSEATYSQLISSTSSINPQISFNVPTFVYLLKVGFFLSETLWQQVGSPPKFEPFIQDYVWLPPVPTIISGGVQAPPKEVIPQETMQIVLDLQGAENYYYMGTELLNQGRFTEALANYEQAQKLNPFSAEIHQAKAVSLYYLQRFTEALQHCEFALQFNPNLAEAHQIKGGILHIQGNFEKALESFETSLQLNPNDFHAYYQKGITLGILGRHHEALVAFENSLQLVPNNSDALHKKGSALWNTGRWEEGLTAYERAIQLNPDNYLAHYDKGSLLQKLGRYEEALLSLNQALRLTPDRDMAHYLKGICLDMLGYSQEALASFDTAIMLNPNLAQAYQGKGIVLDKLGRYEEALQSLEYSLQLDSHSPNILNSIRIVRKHLGFDC
jgi:tetratricopeptide (TPR) repeat protein